MHSVPKHTASDVGKPTPSTDFHPRGFGGRKSYPWGRTTDI